MGLLGLDPESSESYNTIAYLRNQKKLPTIKLKQGTEDGVRVYFLPDVMSWLVKNRSNELIALED